MASDVDFLSAVESNQTASCNETDEGKLPCSAETNVVVERTSSRRLAHAKRFKQCQVVET
jgi:hypothetical protein